MKYDDEACIGMSQQRNKKMKRILRDMLFVFCSHIFFPYTVTQIRENFLFSLFTSQQLLSSYNLISAHTRKLATLHFVWSFAFSSRIVAI